MKYELFEVGGAVRDSLLGIKSKDIDYTVVISDAPADDPAMAFLWFNAQIEAEGFQIFLVTHEMFTIRAKFPKGHQYEGLVADFVMARHEEGFEKGTRRPKICRIGSLEDDLKRRDFTINAMARDMHGNLIDPYNGKGDLFAGVLRCPVDAQTSFNEDPLRILRALRFSITKDVQISRAVRVGITQLNPDRFIETVSVERIREELDKMFRFNSKRAFAVLMNLKAWNTGIFEFIMDKLWFKPTTEKTV